MASKKTIYDKDGNKIGTVEEHTTEDFVRGVEAIGNFLGWLASPKESHSPSAQSIAQQDPTEQIKNLARFCITFAVLAWFIPIGIPALLAIIFGHIALSRMKKQGFDHKKTG